MERQDVNKFYQHLHESFCEYGFWHFSMEEPIKAFMLSFLEGCHKYSWQRQNMDGHFVGSVFVVTHDYQKIALLKHKKLQLWLQPGGHVNDQDLTIFDTAKRECLEELGLSSDDIFTYTSKIFDLDLHMIPAINDLPAHWHLDVRYLLRTTKQELKNSNESEEVAWFDLDDAKLGRPGDQATIRVLKKLKKLRDDFHNNW